MKDNGASTGLASIGLLSHGVEETRSYLTTWMVHH